MSTQVRRSRCSRSRRHSSRQSLDDNSFDGSSDEVRTRQRRRAAVLAQKALTMHSDCSEDDSSHERSLRHKFTELSSDDTSDDEFHSTFESKISNSDESCDEPVSRRVKKNCGNSVIGVPNTHVVRSSRRPKSSQSRNSSQNSQVRSESDEEPTVVRGNARCKWRVSSDDSKPQRCKRNTSNGRPQTIDSSDDSDDEVVTRVKLLKKIESEDSDNEHGQPPHSDEIVRPSRTRLTVPSSSDSEDEPVKLGQRKRPQPCSSSSGSSSDEVKSFINTSKRRKRGLVHSSSSESEMDSDGPSLPRKAVGKALKSDCSMSESDDSDSSCSSGERCIICFKSLLEGAVAKPSACRHVFHDECLTTWSKTSNTCPIDRVKYSATERLLGPDADSTVVHSTRVDTPPPQAHYDEEEIPTVTVPSSIACQICRESDRDEEMLLCDRCELGYHLDCLEPPLPAIPVGDWFCPHCLDNDFEPIDDDELLYLFAESELTNSRLRMRGRGASAVLLSATVRAVSNLAAVTSSLRNPYQDDDDSDDFGRTPRSSGSWASRSRPSTSQPSTSRASSSRASGSGTSDRRRDSDSTTRRSRTQQGSSRSRRTQSSRSGSSRRSGQRRYRVELVTTEDGQTVEVKVAIQARRRRRHTRRQKTTSKRKKYSSSARSSSGRRTGCRDDAGPSTSWDNRFMPGTLDITGSRPTLDYFSPADDEDDVDVGQGQTMLARAGRIGGRSSLISRKEVARVLFAPRQRPRPRIEPAASSSSASILDSILRDQEMWHTPNAQIVSSPSGGHVQVRLPDSAPRGRTAAAGDAPSGNAPNTSAPSGSSATSANSPPSANSSTSPGSSSPPATTAAPLAPPPPPPLIPPPQPPLKLYEDDDFDLYADIEPARPQPRELAPPPAPPVGLLLAAPSSSPEPDDETGGLVIASPPRPPLPPDAYDPESPGSPPPSPPKPPPPPPEEDDIPLPAEPPRKDSEEDARDEESDSEVPITGYYSAAARAVAARASDSDSETERDSTEELVERLRHAGPLGKKKLAALAAPAEPTEGSKPRIRFGVMRRSMLPLRRGEEPGARSRDWFEASRKTPTKAELKGADPEGALDLSVDGPSPASTTSTEATASPFRKLHLLRGARSGSSLSSPYTPGDESHTTGTTSTDTPSSESSGRRRRSRWAREDTPPNSSEAPSPSSKSSAPSPSSKSSVSSEGSRRSTRYTLLPKGRRRPSPVAGILPLDPPKPAATSSSPSKQESDDKYDPGEALSDGSPERLPLPERSPKSPSIHSIRSLKTDDEKASEEVSSQLSEKKGGDESNIEHMEENVEEQDKNTCQSDSNKDDEQEDADQAAKEESCLEKDDEGEEMEAVNEAKENTEELEKDSESGEIPAASNESIPEHDNNKKEGVENMEDDGVKEKVGWDAESPSNKRGREWEKETPAIKTSNWEEETPAIKNTAWDEETPAPKVDDWEMTTPAEKIDKSADDLEENNAMNNNDNLLIKFDEESIKSKDDADDDEEGGEGELAQDNEKSKTEEGDSELEGDELTSKDKHEDGSQSELEDDVDPSKMKKKRKAGTLENGHRSPSWRDSHSAERRSLSSGEVGSSPQYEHSDSGLVDVTDEEDGANGDKAWDDEPRGLEGLGTEAISDAEDALTTPAERPRPPPQPKEEGEIITDDRNEFIPWKRVGKTTRDRTYREKEKTAERETSPEKRKKEKKVSKRQDLERYNVRKMLSDKPKRRKTDEFGRDISTSSDSESGEREGRVRSEVRRIGSDWERKERRRDEKRRRSVSRSRRRSRSPRRRSSPRSGKDRTRPSSRDRRRSRSRTRSRSRSRGRARDRDRKRDPKGPSTRKKSDRKKSPTGSDYSVSTCSCSSCEREKLSQAKKITVTVPNNTAKKTKDKKKDKTRKSKKDKRRRTESPVPSKEVFTSGDNILVSVSFRSGAKNDPKRNGPRRIWEDEARKKKDKENQPARTVIPILAATQEKDRRKQRRKMAGNAKPIAIIDLDPSPFREQAVSPTEVIILTDESDGEGGPKTPPEPPVKFSIGAKGPTLRAMANPLEEGPPTPAADTYDPFEPTKSPSATGSPAPVVPVTPAVPAPPPPPSSPGPTGPTAPAPSSPPSGPGVNGDSPYSPGSSEGDDLFEPPPVSPTPTPTPAPPPPKPLPRLALPLPPVAAKPSKQKRRANAKLRKGGLGTNRKDGTGAAPGTKLDEDQLKMLDEMPNSAVEMQFLKKLNRQERVVEEVKFVLKPHYNKKHITKEEYKEIMRRAVPKICHSRSGEIHPVKIQNLIEAYVKKYRCKRKKAGGPPVTTPQPTMPPSGIQPLKGKTPKDLPPILNMIMGNLGTRSQDTFNRSGT